MSIQTDKDWTAGQNTPASQIAISLLTAQFQKLQALITAAGEHPGISTELASSFIEVHNEWTMDPILSEADATEMQNQLSRHIGQLEADLAPFSATNQSKGTKMNAATATIHSVTDKTNHNATAADPKAAAAGNDASTTSTEQPTVDQDALKKAKRAKAFRTAGAVASGATIVGGAVFAANSLRPIIVDKILDLAGFGPAAQLVEATVVEGAEVLTTATTEAGGFLTGTVEIGSFAVPEAVIAAAAVLAVAAIGYGGYKYYQKRKAKKLEAEAAGVQKLSPEAKIDAAVDALKDGNMKSFLKGMLDGAKWAGKALQVLVYSQVAFILAAVAAGAGYPVIASLIYGAIGLYCIVIGVVMVGATVAAIAMRISAAPAEAAFAQAE